MSYEGQSHNNYEVEDNKSLKKIERQVEISEQKCYSEVSSSPKSHWVIQEKQDQSNLIQQEEPQNLDTQSIQTDSSLEEYLSQQNKNVEKEQDKQSENSFDSEMEEMLVTQRKKASLSTQERNIFQSEKEYNKLIFQLTNYSVKKLLDRDVFKNGVEAITSKSLLDDISYGTDQLQICLSRSLDYEKKLEQLIIDQKQKTETQLSRVSNNFNLVEQIHKQQEEYQARFEKQLSEQKSLQEWLNACIISNLGVFDINNKQIIYDHISLGFLSYKNPCRILVVKLTQSKWFDNTTLLVIIFGSVCQAIYNYNDPDDKTEQNQVVNKILDGCTFYFALEAIIKIIAQGMYRHKNAYLRDTWNILDFFIMMISILDFFITVNDVGDLPSFKALRVLRVLRPLRSVKRIPSMRRLVDILLKSLPDLMNTLFFMTFYLMVFGIIAIQAFFGMTYQRCRLTKQPDEITGIWQIDKDQSDFICQISDYDPKNPNTCKPGTFCGSVEKYSFLNTQGNHVDPYQETSYHWNDPIIKYNTFVFNDIFSALIAVFEAVTRQGWSKQMKMLYNSGTAFGILFYILLIIFGSYFLINLILAVIIGSFQKEKDADDLQNQIKQQVQTKKIMEEQLKAKNSGDLTQQIIKIEGEGESEIQQPIQRQMTVQSQIPLSQKISLKSKIKGLNRKSSIQPNFKPSKPINNDIELNKIQQTEKVSNPEISNLQFTILQNGSFNNLTAIKNENNFDGEETFQHDQTIQKLLHSNQAPDLPYQANLKDLQFYQAKESLSSSFSESSGSSSNKSSYINSHLKKRRTGSSNFQEEPIPEVKKNLDKNNKKSLLKEGGEQSSDEQINEQVEKNCFENFLQKINREIIVKFSEAYSETKIYKFFNKISEHQLFEVFLQLIICVNTIALAMDRYPIKQQESQILELINQVSTFIFIVEMLVKILGQGLKTYFSQGWNLFDCSICLISLVEFVLFQANTNQYSASNDKNLKKQNLSLTFFRAFRLLRAFKLASKFKLFNQMMGKIGLTIKDMLSFFVLLFIVNFVFALLGSQLFSNTIKEDIKGLIVPLGQQGVISPRFNFDTFSNSFLSCSIVIIGDNWQELMHQGIRVNKSLNVSVFYIGLYIIGNWFLMNLFLAILIKNFEESPFDQNEQVLERFEKEEEKQQTGIWLGMKKRCKTLFMTSKLKDNLRQNLQKLIAVKLKEMEEKRAQDEKKKKEEEMNPKKRATSTQLAVDLGKDLEKMQDFQNTQITIPEIIENEQNEPIYIMEGFSLGIFSKENIFRVKISQLIFSKEFEQFILLNVLISSIMMIFDSPLTDQNSKIIVASSFLNLIATIVFLSEFIFKVIVFGLFSNGKFSYLKDGWNLLDFIILIFSLISISFDNYGTKQQEQGEIQQKLELVKMLRVLRSIKIITKNEALKLSVLSLVYALPGIANLLFIIFIFFFIFGIFFLNLFKGKFYYCKFSDEMMNQYLDSAALVTMYDCYNFGGRWENQNLNFDNIFRSMLSLFVMGFNQSWITIMNGGADSVGFGMKPQKLQNYHYQYIFVAYMYLVSNFIKNLFVERVISSHEQERNRLNKNYLLTNFQKEWITIQLKCYELKPTPKVLTHSKFRLTVLKIVEYRFFDTFIMVIILLNTITLCLVWVGISQSSNQMVDYFSQFCNLVFIIEAFLKIVAYQQWYFLSAWDLFDFMVVMFGIVGLFVTQISTTLSAFRILRVCRVLRLLRKAKSLYIIFNTFLNTIPDFFNVGILISILIYMFSTMFNRIFAMVKLNGNMNDLLNFQFSWNSFLILFVATTGENWPDLMFQIGQQKQIDYDCLQTQTYDQYIQNNFQTQQCGDMTSAVIMMIFFQIFVTLVMLNLFIAITLQGYYLEHVEDNCRVTHDQLQRFKTIWTDIDPESTGYIHISQAGVLLRKLADDQQELLLPCMVGILTDEAKLSKLIGLLQLKLYRQYQFYNFHDFLISLLKLNFTSQILKDPFELNQIFYEFNYIKIKNELIYNIKEKEAQTIEDVFSSIDRIAKVAKISLIVQLRIAFKEFQFNTKTKLDKFKNNFYNSQTIMHVVTIQRVYRDFIRARQRKEENKRDREKAMFMRISKLFRRRRYKQYILEDDDNQFDGSTLKVPVNNQIDSYPTFGKVKTTNWIGNKQSNKSIKIDFIEIQKRSQTLDALGQRSKQSSSVSSDRENNEIIFSDLVQQNLQNREIVRRVIVSSQQDNQTNTIPVQKLKIQNYQNLSNEEIKEALKMFIQQRHVRQEPSISVMVFGSSVSPREGSSPLNQEFSLQSDFDCDRNSYKVIPNCGL